MLVFSLRSLLLNRLKADGRFKFFTESRFELKEVIKYIFNYLKGLKAERGNGEQNINFPKSCVKYVADFGLGRKEVMGDREYRVG